MFRRKKDEPEDMKTPAAPPQAPAPASPSEPEAEAVPARPFPRPAPPAAGALGRPPAPPAPRSGVPARTGESIEGRKLIVGKEIVLSGQITSCERLVVEGRVEASLDSRWMEITDTGVFKGMAEIENAEIAGVFEGTLTVREKLMIRSGGKVSGTIRYARIEIEEGGQISGEVSVDASRAAKTDGASYGNDGG
ncbi:MAG: polymer-forming cytoskeletal protein [Tagaea sp.]|jgi:cytoskeletal protein CcmA (bactofilin family)|nr:polymer-forming cytoskeletal protein [Magnetospirillum sp.]